MKRHPKINPAPESYQHRAYRGVAETSDLHSVYVKIRETDLHILTDSDASQKAQELTAQFRLQVEHYIGANPDFSRSLVPLPEDKLAPPMIREMFAAGIKASVGPMAAVAGAIAQYVGDGLLEAGLQEVIVENGGDIYLNRSVECTVAVFAGTSALSNRVGLRIPTDQMPLGICTSSGTVGHSLSLGKADSVTVVADSAVLADAAATRIGNEAGTYRDPQEGVQRALEAAETIPEILGLVVICEEALGAKGMVELVSLQ